MNIEGKSVGHYGSYVNGSDVESGIFTVIATHKQYHETTLDLTINGEVIHTTDEHPFLVKDDEEYRWVEAQHLNIGDIIVASDGSFGVIEAVIVINEPQKMYNLTVHLVATYVVGEGQWVVHNVAADYRTIEGIPIGFTEDWWRAFVQKTHEFNLRFDYRLNLPDGTYYAQGSRVSDLILPSRVPAPNADFDFMLRVNPGKFGEFRRFIEALMRNPNLRIPSRRAKEITRQLAQGQVSKFTPSTNAIDPDFNDQFWDEFFVQRVRPHNAQDLDFSIIQAGSKLDSGPLICIK